MMELYLNTVYNLDPGKFLREGRFVILEYSPNFLKEAQPNVMAAPNSSETYMFYLNTQLNVKLFNCCRCTGMTHPEYWWCQQYLTKDKFSEEEETNFEMYTTQSDYRNWREYLVRDVKFKNKSPVSWSFSPPGSNCLPSAHSSTWREVTTSDVNNVAEYSATCSGRVFIKAFNKYNTRLKHYSLSQTSPAKRTEDEDSSVVICIPGSLGGVFKTMGRW